MLNLNSKIRFFDPSQILPYTGIGQGHVVADFGCGNGYYPIAAAKLVGDDGQVYAVDVKEAALEATMSAAKHEGLKNVYTIKHDLEKSGVPIENNSCDAVILAGILHLANIQKNVLREAYKVLKTGGKVVIIEWKKEQLPFGPEISRRISEPDMNSIMAAAGFRFHSEVPADHFHYALIFVK